MLTIVLNGQPRQLTPGCNLLELLDKAGYAGRRIAVEINREIVPRSLHAHRQIRDGDRIEIVHALGGG
ncbi:MAG: sulfur carrier protein ThiS [Rudaea sp.]